MLDYGWTCNHNQAVDDVHCYETLMSFLGKADIT